MDIGKTCVTVAASEDDHLVSNQIGRVITLLLGQVASRTPFLPGETRWIRDVQRPYVVERCLSIPASKHDKIVAIEYGGVRAARWGYGTARHSGARETASDRIKCPDVVAIGWTIAAPKDVELVAHERRGMSTKRRHGLARGVQGGPFQGLRIEPGGTSPTILAVHASEKPDPVTDQSAGVGTQRLARGRPMRRKR